MDGLVCGWMNRASVREPGLARVCHCAQEAACVPEVLGTVKTRRGGEKDEGGQGGRRARSGAGAGGRRGQSPGLPALQERRRGARGSQGCGAGPGYLSEDGEQLCRQHSEKSPFASYKFKVPCHQLGQVSQGKA